jgi:hypothetical protein
MVDSESDSDPDSDSWEQTLVRFRAHFDTLIYDHNGQPSGGLIPEKALAKLTKYVKEDLKRSVSDFFTAFSFIVSLICQPGNSRSVTRKPEKQSAPGMGKHT